MYNYGFAYILMNTVIKVWNDFLSFLNKIDIQV